METLIEFRLWKYLKCLLYNDLGKSLIVNDAIFMITITAHLRNCFTHVAEAVLLACPLQHWLCFPTLLARLYPAGMPALPIQVSVGATLIDWQGCGWVTGKRAVHGRMIATVIAPPPQGCSGG